MAKYWLSTILNNASKNSEVMADTEKVLFTDRDVPPTDESIFKHIGSKKKFWISIMTFISDNYKDMQGSWKYYNDGKRWLFRMVQKKKTIFWSSVFEGAFRITFYFGGKAEPVITASDLPDEAKSQFLTGPRYGQIRAISMFVSTAEDVVTVEKLVKIKSKLK